MCNTEIFAVSEFRRFVNKHFYPFAIGYLAEHIRNYCEVDQISFESMPQPTIKFTSRIKPVNKSQYTIDLHNILKDIFISCFNDENYVKLIMAKIYTEEPNINQSEILYNTLEQIQQGNPTYLSLLFNITVLDNSVYLYL